MQEAKECNVDALQQQRGCISGKASEQEAHQKNPWLGSFGKECSIGCLQCSLQRGAIHWPAIDEEHQHCFLAAVVCIGDKSLHCRSCE